MNIASGGGELGRILAKNLGYQYVDKSLFQEIAEALHVAVDKLGISPDQAHRVIERRDRNHEWFHRSVYGDSYDSPLLFHLTLNTGLISIKQAAGIILSLVGTTKK